MLFHFTLADYYAHFTNPLLHTSLLIAALIISAIVRANHRDSFCQIFTIFAGTLYALAVVFTVLLDIFVWFVFVISMPIAHLMGVLFVSVWELV